MNMPSLSMNHKQKNLFVPEYGDPREPEVRVRYAYLEATVSIIGNIGLFFLKVLLGLFINSVGLIADGIHSLSDVSSSLVILFGFRIVKKPADTKHPFGHGRSEYITTLIIALLLILTGFTFMYQAAQRIINPEPLGNQEILLIIVAIIFITVVIKELMARYSYVLSKKIQSDALHADGWHHRSDALSSLIVIIGILGSQAGFAVADSIAGFIVAFFIIYIGVKLVRISSDNLLGKAPDNELLQTIKKIALTTPGVTSVHKLHVHDYGLKKVVTLHAEVQACLTVEESHIIATDIESSIKNETQYSANIHIEPQESCNDCTKIDLLKQFLKKQKEIISYDELKITRTQGKDTITVNLSVDKDMSVEKSNQLKEKLQTFYTKRCGPCCIDIHFTPA